MDSPKTKQVISILKNLQLTGKKSLVVFPENNENVYLSLRNIPSVKGTLISDINTYDIVNANILVFTESVAKIFTEEEVEVVA